jgi:inhibitor of cysteine peptidase
MKKILKIIAVLLVISAVMFAAGCAENAETEENKTQAEMEQAPADTSETPAVTEENTTENATENLTENDTTVNETMETGMVVTADDNGTNITVKQGENFTVKLQENPSTGYSWQLNVTEGLSILSDEYIQDPAPEGYTGVPGNHTWIIQAMEPGNQTVDGIYKRPWENTTGTEDNFTIAVEVI